MASPTVPIYEKLGAFYLGRVHDAEAERTTDELLLYDAKDLTTHAVCVGMTGSGKTGLCVSLLEEAAIDGIPAIAIDPKGDIGNLMLTFPQLRPADFRPWVDEAEAQRKGMTVDEYAKDRADLWRKGLKSWDQDGTRIQRLRDAAEVTIYTPGSSAGRPLRVLRSFDAPPAELRDDGDLMRERVTASVSGLLALVGVDGDPVRSREHILLAAILDRAWREGRNLDLPALIGAVQSPPFTQVGVMDVEAFYPSKDRFGLAMALNGLLASPGFSAWMEGDPLDIGRLLYTADGRPRVSVLSIAHLSDAERMFFVTILLNEVVAWMRTRPGTSSLRALLYMDEVFGFFPPTANPPSKTPMLTLLKQARAYGLGVVLATQNPVDLDYKGLSNTGTWFIGRLQTERDKMRLLDGLEGASSGGGFDRAAVERTLSGLNSRVFLMNNVHDEDPVVFHTRWAMSYLRGPLTRMEIERLTPRDDGAGGEPAARSPHPSSKSGASGASGASAASAAPPARSSAAPPPARAPAAPPGVPTRYLPLARALPASDTLVYRPALLASGQLHYVRTAANVDEWHDLSLLALLDEPVPSNPWEYAVPIGDAGDIETEPDRRGTFLPLPPSATRPKQYPRWTRSFVDHIYRHHDLDLWRCKALKAYSELGADEGDFRILLRDKVREKRDLAVEKLRKRYTSKLATLKERIRKAEARVEVEKGQFRTAGLQTAVSFGTAVLGAFFGRKVKSVGTVGRAGTALRGASRTAQQKSDIGRAEETVESLQQQLVELEQEFETEIDRTDDLISADDLELEAIALRPRKSDVRADGVTLVWAPYRMAPSGISEPLFAAAQG